MRMAGPDIVLFAVGLLLFAGASYALVQQGSLGASATGVYALTHPVSTLELGSQNVASFASATATFEVDQTSVSTVTFVLRCTDPIPGGTFNMQVQIEPPAASGITVEPQAVACSGAAEVPVEVAPVPADGTVQASSPEDAVGQADDDANATKAVGTWTITVQGRRGSGPLPGLPQGNPAGSIAMNAEAWTTTATATNPK